MIIQLWYCFETDMPSTQEVCSAGRDGAHLDCTFQNIEVTEIGYNRVGGDVSVHLKVAK